MWCVKRLSWQISSSLSLFSSFYYTNTLARCRDGAHTHFSTWDPLSFSLQKIISFSSFHHTYTHISFAHSGPSSDSTPLSYQIKFLIIVIELVKIPKLLSCFDIIAPNLMTFLLLFMVGFIYEDWGRTNMKKKLEWMKEFQVLFWMYLIF